MIDWRLAIGDWRLAIGDWLGLTLRRRPRDAMNRRNLMTAMLAAAAASAAGLPGCAGIGIPTVITLSETELRLLLTGVFPIQRRVLELFELELTSPTLRLLPAQNRLALTLNLSSRERLSGKVGSGHLAFDSTLRYDTRDASIRLAQVRIDKLSFEVGTAAVTHLTVQPTGQPTLQPTVQPTALPSHMARIGQALAERALEDLAIYRVPAERQATLRQLGLQPGAVTVTPLGLKITLVRPGQ